MHKDGKFSDSGRTRQKYCCPLKRSKMAIALVITNVGIMARKIAVVLNT